MTLVRPLMTSLKMTVRDDFAVSACSPPLLSQSVQSLSHVQLFVTPWTAAGPASLSITNTQSLLKLMSIESVMPSNHIIPCHPLLLLPSVFPRIRVFSNESNLHMRWPNLNLVSWSNLATWKVGKLGVEHNGYMSY